MLLPEVCRLFEGCVVGAGAVGVGVIEGVFDRVVEGLFEGVFDGASGALFEQDSSDSANKLNRTTSPNPLFSSLVHFRDFRMAILSIAPHSIMGTSSTGPLVLAA